MPTGDSYKPCLSEFHFHGWLQCWLQLRPQEGLEEHPPEDGPQVRLADRGPRGHHGQEEHKLCLWQVGGLCQTTMSPHSSWCALGKAAPPGQMKLLAWSAELLRLQAPSTGTLQSMQTEWPYMVTLNTQLSSGKSGLWCWTGLDSNSVSTT